MNALITVLDSINPTTMPYNEFILYRNAYYPEERQIVLLTGSEITIPQDQIPKTLEIHHVGKNPIAIRKELKTILGKLKKDNVPFAIHLHSIRGSFSTLIALIGTGKMNRTVYSVHSTFPGFKLHNKVFSVLDALLSSCTTCVSNASYRAYPGFVKRLKGDRVLPLQNGVNIRRIDQVLSPGPKSVPEDEADRFVYVARLIPLLPFDVSLWAEEIDRYARMDAGERQRLGERCRDYVREHFSLESMHRKYDAIYDDLRAKQ